MFFIIFAAVIKKMKWNIKLTWIAIGYILINILFAWHASTMTGGTSLIYVLIFPSLWLITIIAVGILTYRKRKGWFKKEIRFSTIVLLLFCTPIPLLVFTELTKPEMTRAGSGYNPKNGRTYKTETWTFKPGVLAIKKYWVLETEDWIRADESGFKKDSTWIYFDKNGDTLKTEKYLDDKLIESKEYK